MYGSAGKQTLKLIKLRSKVERGILVVALIFFTMPMVGLFTGVAFGTGYSKGYFEALLSDDPSGYWYIIKLEFFLASYILLLAFFDFPLIKYSYEQVIIFKNNHKVVSYLGLYLVFPILFLTFIFSLPFIF